MNLPMFSQIFVFFAWGVHCILCVLFVCKVELFVCIVRNRWNNVMKFTPLPRVTQFLVPIERFLEYRYEKHET